MKRLLGVLLCLALLSNASNAAIVFLEDFEDTSFGFGSGVGMDASMFSVTDALFHDGGSDYFHSTAAGGAVPADGPYTGFAGSHFFAAEDIDDGATRPITQTLSYTIDITNQTALTFDGLFAAGGNAGTNRYDGEDGVRVRATIDGGATQNLLAFETIGGAAAIDSQVAVDADFDGIGDAAGFMPTAAFTAFNGIAIAGTGTSLLLEIEVTAEGSGNEYAFDNITINGIVAVPEPSSFAALAFCGAMVTFRRRRKRVS